MQADEAQYQPNQTQAHITPIIKQITQLSLGAAEKTQMPSVRCPAYADWLLHPRAVCERPHGHAQPASMPALRPCVHFCVEGCVVHAVSGQKRDQGC